MQVPADGLEDPEPLARAAGWATDGEAVDMIEMVSVAKEQLATSVS